MKKINKFDKSMKLFEEASKYLPAGVSSNARVWKGAICPSYMPCSIFIKKAYGSHIWDVDGNEYIDYRLGYGPVILGHSFEYVRKAVHEAETKGTVYALDNELEITVAKKIKSLVKCADMIRYANSGTEATMTAIRLARWYTDKEKIIKFEGHYHGHHDYLLFNTFPPFDSVRRKPIPASYGIPERIKDYIIIEDWNDFGSIERTVKKYHNEVAAIICEPVMGNAAVMPPEEGYLKHLRKLCDDYGIVLIFDEVKTGFRLSKGGAQGVYNIKPDLATFAKSLGNGYPIAALVGIQDIMEEIAPNKVLQGGTYSGNRISLTAANATLDFLNKKDVFRYLNKYGKKLMRGIQDLFEDHKINAIVQGFPEMFQFLFTKKDKIITYRDLKFCDMQLFAKLQFELLKRGVMIDEDNGEPMYTCYSHNEKDLQDTLGAIEEAIHVLE